MSRMNRRQFTWVATSGVASAALVACGADAVDENLTPTRIPDVAGAPPTLAPHGTPFSSEDMAEEEVAEEEAVEEVVAEPDAAEEEVVAEAPGEAITVEALDTLEFNPSEFEAAPGQEIHVVNAGALQHDFVIDELDLATELLNGGEEATITVPEDAAPGEYVFYCSVPGHREGGMEGTMTIVEAGAAAAEGEEEEAPAEEEEAAAAGAGEAITVEALDTLEFDPSEFEVAPGQEIHVVNAGALQHDFVVDELDLATELLNGGEEATITVPEDAAPGEYVFYCSVPGHREGGMEGTMTVVEAGAAAGAEEEEEPAEEVVAEEAEEEEAGDGAEAAAGGETLEVIAVDIDFEPSELSMPADTDVEIHVVNEGVLQHDFVIEDTEYATELLNGGEEATITVNLPAGEYVYFCSVPGHREAGMEGTLTVG